MNTNDTIREFITQEMLHGNLTSKIENDDQLLESGIIDSLGIMTLLSFIEENFSIQIQGEDLIPENFASILTISALVDSHLKN